MPSWVTGTPVVVVGWVVVVDEVVVVVDVEVVVVVGMVVTVPEDVAQCPLVLINALAAIALPIVKVMNNVKSAADW